MAKAKSDKKKRPAYLWAFWANAYGPRYTEPVKVTERDNVDSYYDETGNNGIPYKFAEGCYSELSGTVIFSARTKDEVIRFIDGYRAALRMQQPAAAFGTEDIPYDPNE